MRATKFGPIVFKVLTLLSNIKTLKRIGSNFCGPLRKPQLYVTFVGVTFLPTFFERKAPKVEALLFEHKV